MVLFVKGFCDNVGGSMTSTTCFRDPFAYNEKILVMTSSVFFNDGKTKTSVYTWNQHGHNLAHKPLELKTRQMKSLLKTHFSLHNGIINYRQPLHNV